MITKQFPYQNPDLPIEDRIADLLSRLTLDEKIDQMGYQAAAIPRLSIPAYNYWNEALHGVARNGRATVFPQAIGMAATWNPELVRRVASAIGDEARAKYHEALRNKGFSDWYQGLTFWSPNINIFRDPRWGRGQETWGEDPYLTGEMGAAFVRGLQGDDPRYLKAAACAKHYAVHSGPESSRHTFDAHPTRRDLRETYLPAFKKLVTEARVEAVMGAYNRVYGEPSCASQLLLNDILRGEWGFEGHVVSDCGAITDFHANHKVTADEVESAALAVRMGCDLACDGVISNLREAILRGIITEAEIDKSLARTLHTRFKLGMFDPQEQVPYAQTPLEVVGCDAHRALAREAAAQSIVLLKNTKNLLPLMPATRSIAVVGPNAASLDPLLGNYAGINERMTTFLEGIIAGAPADTRIEYRAAVPLAQSIRNLFKGMGAESVSFDVTIVCVGLSPLLEGEEGDAILSPDGDRDDICLPEHQADYIKHLHNYGGKTVLVLNAGSALDISEVEPLVDAILYAWYPGQEGGNALADVLFGKTLPSGKLPISFPRLADLPAFDDYNMAGRTYRYMAEEPLYPFGFGLSFTTFAYRDIHVDSPKSSGFEATVSAQNTGSVAANEVVQFYLSALESRLPAPISKLIGFQRVHLQPGESKTVELTVTPEMLMLYDEDGIQKLEPGKFRLTAGGCSPGARSLALGAPQPATIEFHIS